MEMHQVRYFLAVNEEKNFTRAAERCNVSQPSLTKAIKKLEDELSGPLFRRERQRTHLTDLGRIMLPHLERIYYAAETARDEAQGFKQLELAPLKLGVMCTIGPARLVSFFEQLKREVPTIELSLREASGRELLDEMTSGELDIALLGMPELPDQLRARPLYSERYVIAFYKGHRFETMNTVALSELDQEDYLQRVNCEYPDHFAILGDPLPCEVKVRYRSEREDWIQAMILAGLGCSIMPEFLPAMPGISTRIVVEPELMREISLVTVAGRRYSPPVEACIRLAQRHDWGVIT